MTRFYFIFILFYLVVPHSIGQKDTRFWFVAPEVAVGAGTVGYDRPVALKFSTFGSSANVSVSQPANPTFQTLSFTIPAGSTHELQFPPQFDQIENIYKNQISNRGILVQSDEEITVYYEVIGACKCNPEIFSLKGSNALGNKFFVPFQNYLPNSNANNHVPAPYAAFDIVATEDNTIVSIIPTQPLVGRLANIPFDIILNRGETYSGAAASRIANFRPTGTSISSNKPIAVTMKDDLLDATVVYGSNCRDLIGDQLVPVNNVGTEYVILKGFLSGDERVFIVATEDNTIVSYNDIVVANLNSGQTFEIIVRDEINFINSSKPIYSLQVTGNGCELGAALLPSLKCRGSDEVRFIRPTADPFWLFIVLESGNEDGFLVNGVGGIINSSSFSIVPGTSGKYVAAKLPFSINIIQLGASTSISNTKGVFQLGILNGSSSITGARFGYFSNFGVLNKVSLDEEICAGDTLVFMNQIITEPGIYLDTILGTLDCDTLVELDVKFSTLFGTEEISLCIGDTYVLNGFAYTKDTIVFDTLQSLISCDTIVEYNLIFKDYLEEAYYYSLCDGDTLNIDGILITESTIFKDTISSDQECEEIRTHNIEFISLDILNISMGICAGDTLFFMDQIITEPGIYLDTILGTLDCDTLVELDVKFSTLFLTEEISLCIGDTYVLNGFAHTKDTIVFDTSLSFMSCDTIVEYNLIFKDYLKEDYYYSLCDGDTLNIDGILITESSILIDTFSNDHECGEIMTHIIEFISLDTLNFSLGICPGDTAFMDDLIITNPGIYEVININQNGCEDLIIYEVLKEDERIIDLIFNGCEGDSIYFNQKTYFESGFYLDTILNGDQYCDTIFEVQVNLTPLNEEIYSHLGCSGDTIHILNNPYSTSQTVVDTIYDLEDCGIIQVHNIIISDLNYNYLPTYTVPHGDQLRIDININSTYSFEVSWNVDGLEIPSNLNYIELEILNDLIIIVKVTDELNCIYEFQIDINVILPDCEEFVFIPNAISPNKDGINDNLGLFVKQECVSTIKEIKIFDRWGSLMYESKYPQLNSDNIGWDGKYKNKDVPAGVYIYYAVVEMYDGEEKILSGEISVLK